MQRRATGPSLIRSLRTKVLLAFVLLALVPLAILALFNNITTRRALIDSANQTLFVASMQTAARLDDFIESELNVILSESQLPSLGRYLHANASNLNDSESHKRALATLRTLSQKDPVFVSSYALLDLQGRNVLDTNAANIGRAESARDYFQVALETGKPFVSSVEFEPGDGVPYLYFSHMIFDPETDKPLGVMRLRYGAAVLQQQVIQGSSLLGSQSYPLLLDQYGLILADGLASPGSTSSLLYQMVQPVNSADQLPFRPQKIRLTQSPELAESLQRAGSTNPFFSITRSGRAEAAAVTWMKTQPWLVVFLEPQALLLAPAEVLVHNAILLAGIILLLVVAVAVAAARLLTNPIVHLTETARQISEGRLEARAAIDSRDEIGVLANAFNTMSDQVQSLVGNLRHSEEKFRVLVQKLQTAVVVHASDTRILIANPMAQELLGLSEDQLLGKSVIDPSWHFLREDGSEMPLDEYPVNRVLSSHSPLHNYVVGVHRPDSNGDIWALVNAVPVFNEEHEVTQVIVSFIDISENRRAQQELRHYRDHLEETVQERTEELRLARDAADSANKAKSVFLANMSHELRTPLNAILGFSQLMRQDQSLSSSQQINLEIINKSGDHLLQLINDVLEIAKIEAGKLHLEIATFDLHKLVREVSDMMRLKAQQKGLQLQLDQSSEFPRLIKGDEARLRQILVNLVSNAVKFTEQGGVTIRLGSKQNAQHHLIIEIEDTGPGISSIDQQRLFKPFEQLSAGSTHGGTGLGLAIVKQFVQLMGGNVSLESKPGKGSLFRVELPLEKVDEDEITRLVEQRYAEIVGLAPGQPVYRILIAEDQRDNQLLLSKLMSNLGLETRVAENGEKCVQMFQEWQPDLIWMDWRMPVMDGDEATRQIRQLPGGGKVKIVAVTASALKEQETSLFASGMDDYVCKPYRLDEIYHSLEKQLGLKWEYANTDSELEALLVEPPREQLQELYQLADEGKIFEIQEQASRLQAENEAYIPFTQQLLTLAKQFDIEGIIAFIKQFLK